MFSHRSLTCSLMGIALAALALSSAPAVHAQVRLTGAIVYGATNNSGFYNTNAPDGSFDMAIIAGAPDQGGAAGSGFNARNGAFLNNLSNARIDILLSAPGDYTYTILGGTSFAGPFNGLNLFFENVDATPRISVFGPQQTDVAVQPGFSVNSSASSLNLAAVVTPASGTATFSSGGLNVTLIGFSYGGPGLYSSPTQVDRLGSSIASGPGGGGDTVGQFTLRVTSIAAAPEPGSIALTLLGGVGLLGAVVRRRKH